METGTEKRLFMRLERRLAETTRGLRMFIPGIPGGIFPQF
jgi:hypothetical protein